MLQVKEERITNNSVRERFFKLPNAKSMIAARQLSYLGKMVRNHGDDHLPKQFLTAWVNNPRPRGQPLYTNEKSLINSLNHILPSLPEEPDADPKSLEMRHWKRVREERKNGKLSEWIQDAYDEKYWEWLIDTKPKLRKPHIYIPTYSARS